MAFCLCFSPTKYSKVYRNMAYPTCYLPIEPKKDIRKTYLFESGQQNDQNYPLLIKKMLFTTWVVKIY